jgi:restriction system protein
MRKRKNKTDEIVFDFGMIILCLTFAKTHNVKTAIIIFCLYMCVILILLIIFKNILNRRKEECYIHSSMDIVDKMSGEDFENFLSAYLIKMGYSSDTTPKAGDYGADLIVKKGTEKLIVQAKRWKKRVGIEAIQQIVGAKKYYNATNCLVVTNNYFTYEAKSLAEANDVELCDRDKLVSILKKVNCNDLIKDSQDINKKETTKEKDKIICDKCGGEMILKHGRYGDFYGCSNYPKCRNTKPILK